MSCLGALALSASTPWPWSRCDGRHPHRALARFRPLPPPGVLPALGRWRQLMMAHTQALRLSCCFRSLLRILVCASCNRLNTIRHHLKFAAGAWHHGSSGGALDSIQLQDSLQPKFLQFEL